MKIVLLYLKLKGASHVTHILKKKEANKNIS